jgi:hypothetical protein
MNMLTYSLTIVDAFLQLAKATRLVGFSVMQFTIDLTKENPSVKGSEPTNFRQKVQSKLQEESYMWETCVAAQPMLNTAAKKL